MNERLAEEFATKAHHGQVRKYTNEPYITHPAAVVALIKSVPHTEDMVIAGWLHDTEEDCGTKNEEIARNFGSYPAILVAQVTDISKKSDGNRAKRKAIDRAHTARAFPEAKTVKLCDVIDNCRSIVQHDPSFARVYLPEKRLLLDEALREGDALLWAIADEIICKGLENL